MIPKRLPQSIVAEKLYDNFGIVINKIKKTSDKTVIMVPLQEVPEKYMMTEEEFSRKFKMSYKGNLNHALKNTKEVKSLIMEIISGIEPDEINFADDNCKIIISEEKEIEQESYDSFHTFKKAEWDDSIDDFLVRLRGEV